MKEALVQPDLEVEIHDVPVPKPGPGEVLIKIEVAGCNPKDWKSPHYSKRAHNSGDDMAGLVEAVGEGVLEFKPGDRVAAMHVMGEPHGSFAEYSVAPASTTFHIPAGTSFEEAATIPLAALTAVIALYYNLELPSPWTPAQAPTPLVVYGASSACGAFAIKLARRSNIHPIIAIAGKSKDLVSSLIDSSKGDIVVDYRDKPEDNIQTVEKHLQKLKIPGPKYGFDTIGDAKGIELTWKMMQPDGHFTDILPGEDYSSIPKSYTTSVGYVGAVHGTLRENKTITHTSMANGEDYGYVYSRLFTRGLQEGWFSGHPFDKKGGLEDISQALKDLKSGKASGVKYVFPIS